MMRWSQPQKKRIYALNEGSAEERSILGEKGANLCEMHRLGMPVPAAFILTTDSCNEFFNKHSDSDVGTAIFEDVRKAVHALEKKTGQAFYAEGCGKRDIKKLPLLLSVRSAAPENLPGMTETVLNLGINEEVVDVMSRVSDNSRWALDTHRRFLQMFGNVVMGVEKIKYEAILAEVRESNNVENDSQLDVVALSEVVRRFRGLAEVPEDPWEQLRMCIEAVFNSWYSPEARRYRDVNSLSETAGVAVVVQKMAHGNVNALSGSGVAHTRNPLTGAAEFSGKFMTNSAGEEVLGGVRVARSLQDLEAEMTHVYEKLQSCAKTLEAHYRDMQDIEFTVENQELFILETGRGRRTARAAVTVVVGMVEDKIITEREALMRIDPAQMEFFLHPMIDCMQVDVESADVRARVIGKGVSASTGAVMGRLAFTSAQVMEFAARNESSILVKYDTHCTEDLVGMRGSVGCITMLGGYTSHTAIVMRSMGKPCVTCLRDHLSVDVLKDELVVKTDSGRRLKKGDMITVDGATGTVYAGELPITMAAADENFQKIMNWADKYKRMRVLANTRTQHDVNLASRLGAEGVGLCRTEAMFFDEDRVDHVRRAVLVESPVERRAELMKLLAAMQQDFVDMFLVMQHRPIKVRLLDRALSDFLPDPKSEDYENEVLTMAGRLSIPPERCFERILELQESNPTLGNRGTRLALSMPEFAVLQTEAVVGAALELRSHHIVVKPQLLLPMICTDHEVDLVTPIICKASDRICAHAWSDSNYQSAYVEPSVGAILELPRSCLRADKIAKAKHVDFLSIGTNDLTQLMFGFSREDAHQFMPNYVEKHMVARNPFVSIDKAGVGTMISTAVTRAKSANHNVQVGVCGDHCGDPLSVLFFEKVGIDYVSCSPYKVPIAKIAAAQAHILETSKVQVQQQVSWAQRMF